MSSTPAPTTLPEIDVWIFDLDNTLYAADSDLFSQVDRRMGEFIASKLALDGSEARALQKKYFKEHGTTLRGLMTVDGIDPRAFLDYVHDIDLSAIGPDRRLGAALTALSGRFIVYTNGSVPHAQRILARLGIADLFEHIEDIVAANFVPKPSQEPYRQMVARLGIDPNRAIMVEDIAANLVPARALGMTTAWVQTNSAPGGTPARTSVDFVVRDLAGWLEGVVAARGAGAGLCEPARQASPVD